MQQRVVLGVLVALCTSSFAAPPKQAKPAKPTPTVPEPLRGPDAEVTRSKVDIKLPEVPSFDPPVAPAPGVHSIRELRVAGTALLDSKIKVRGYVIWIYDCLDAIRQPKESRAAAQRRIDDDQTICERKKLYLGDAKTTPLEKGLWVVDVPRPPFKLEKQRLPKEELAAWPKVPKLKVGDYVEITGDFKIHSPHSEHNSDGLLVFESVVPVKPAKEQAPHAASAPADEPAVPGISPATPPPVPALAPVLPADRDRSVASLAAANKQFGMKQPTEAIASYRAAITAWPQNHLAWYGLGGAFAMQRDWKGALDAFEHARAIRPDQAMYQMWAGVAAYEAAMLGAKEQEAARTGRKPEEVTIDASTVNFDSARERLRIASTLEPHLWRAHYYLGRIYRARGEMRFAAVRFGQAILERPFESGPYVALGELYRKWDYTQQSMDVTSVGLANVQGPDVSDVAFVLGMGYDDKLDYKQAIDAFTKALDAKSTNHKARFQRGQAYFKSGKLDDAKKDLEAFVAAGSGLAFAEQQANKMLAEIEAKTAHKK